MMPAREFAKAKCAAIGIALLAVSAMGGCAADTAEEEENLAFAACPSSLAGEPWTPQVPGAQSTLHDGAVVISRTESSKAAPLLGLGQGANCSSVGGESCPDTTSRIVTFTFTVPDLGDNGSISLIAEPYSMPSDLVGSAWPLLVSLTSPAPAKEWVGFDLSAGSSCSNEGFFTCSNGYCSQNGSCTTGAQSAFKDWSHWRQNNIPAFGFPSTNTFPTCNWTGGTPTCHFTEGAGYFSAGKLPAGTYTAKYVLLASSYSSLSSNYRAGIKLTVVSKKDDTAVAASGNGAFDLNVVIIGKENVRDSRTEKGKANLNALFEHVHRHYSSATTGTGVGIGRVTAYEVCGDTYANVDFTEVGDLLEGGSERVSQASEGKAINVFLVSSIQYNDANLTILGAAGKIGGPMINGTGSSGVVFSTFNDLDVFNAECVGSTCLIDDQEEDFIEMGNTVSHELGHYLGLNHLSEMDGSRTDPLPDTPACTASNDTISHSSCLTPATACRADCDANGGWNGTTAFCPAAEDCEFNHVMWYTTKRYNTTTGEGDGHIFSPDSSIVVNSNPLVQ